MASINQREGGEDRTVPVVITTHKSREGAVQLALKEIDALGTILRPTVCVRIVDQPEEFAAA